MAIAAPVQETELVRLAQEGDRSAFQQLYEAYLPRIFDFVSGMLNHRADAEDATSETFLLAVEQLSDLRQPAAFKSWLYSIARHAALRVITSRSKAVPIADVAEGATAIDAAPVVLPDEQTERNEMRELLDEAASTLGERERDVYHLTIRHGLRSSDVARVLNVRPAYAYMLVNRLTPSVSEALEAVVLARVGTQSCSELAAVLDAYPNEVSPRMRKAVARHAKACGVCGETKRHRASVAALVAGSAFVPSAAFAAELSARIDAHWTLYPPNGPPDERGHLHLVGAAVAVVLLAGLAFGLGAQRTITDDYFLEPVAQTRPQASTPEPTPTPEPQRPAQRGEPSRGAQQPRGEGRASVVLNNSTGDSGATSGDSGFGNSSAVTSESTEDHGHHP